MPTDATQAAGFWTAWTQFWDSWALFRDPALAGSIAGAMLGWLGVYVVVRRMVFLTAALSQAAGLGVAAAWYAQIHWGWPAAWATPTAGAALATATAAGGMLAGRGGLQVRRDGALGWVYLTGAAATLALGTRIVQEVQDIETILFGSAVTVAADDLHRLAWLAAAVLAVHALGLRGFVQWAVDEDGARVRGLPTRWLGLAVVVSLAAAVSLATRMLGALPVFAFTVLPALAALRLAPHVGAATLLAALGGAVAGLGGYVLAFVAQLPVGAAQTLCCAVWVVLAVVVSWGLELWHRRVAHGTGHVHGPGCGHVAVVHGDHIDYLHDGHLDHPSDLGHELHALAAPPRTGAHLRGGEGHDPRHVHGPACGHPPVIHGDHVDYLVDGTLHHPHGDHCDHHGELPEAPVSTQDVPRPSSNSRASAPRPPR
jgi:zinc transport system permease protein